MGLFRRTRKDEDLDPDDRSPESGVKYKDLAVVSQLLKNGADMAQPRHALYYLYFDSEAAAAEAAGRAAERGFQADVREPLPDYPGQWSLVCEMNDVVLDLPTIREHGDLFDSIATNGGGEYDGWEASV